MAGGKSAGLMDWEQLLSSERVRKLAGGRASEGSDHRTEFQRDFDRVIFSSPVRRLQDKTQVFPLEPNDSVRTRLTHSMEVSTLCRGIVRKIESDIEDLAFESNIQNIEIISATAGLVHDLGNPPFGHFGENAIAYWFGGDVGKEATKLLSEHSQLLKDFTNYEGNARTLRLLCHLQILADRHGLNLTAATVSACMKYIASSDNVDKTGQDHPRSKPGFLFAEREIVERVRTKTGTGASRHPIAFIVEAADDCVYALCDLEDAIRKDVLSWDDLKRELTIYDDRHIPELLEKTERGVKGRQEGSSLQLAGKTLNDAYAQMFRVNAAIKIVDGAAKAFVDNYDAIMSGTYKGELLDDDNTNSGARYIVKACKEVGRDRVYNTRANAELELRGYRVIHDLLDVLWSGIKDYDGEAPKNKTREGKAWNLLSENYRTVFEADWKNIPVQSVKEAIPEEVLKQYYRLLLLTDYVGGMTDTFACTLHKALVNG